MRRMCHGDIPVSTTVSANTGEGSFAKVYIGRHLFTNEEVVIKAVDKKKVLESNIYTEIEVLRKVSHPYINKLYAAYEQGRPRLLWVSC